MLEQDMAGYGAGHRDGYQEGLRNSETNEEIAFRDGYDIGLEAGKVEGVGEVVEHIYDMIANVEMPLKSCLVSYASFFRMLKDRLHVNDF